MPDGESVPAKAKGTGWLYQPSWSGGRSGVAEVTTGGVLSTLTVAVAPAKVPPQDTVQVRLVPGAGVSLVNVAVLQPSVPVSPEGVQLQRSVTSVRCHVPQPTGVRSGSVHDGVTVLACAAPGAAT